MQPSIEILVHISAPSGTVHDANHRALAAAFAQFEPTTRIRVWPTDRQGTDVDEDLNPEEVSLDAESHNFFSPISSNGNSDAEYDEGDSMFYDSLDIGKEGIQQDDTTAACLDQDIEEDSYETPPETVPDSQPSFSPASVSKIRYDTQVDSTAGENSVMIPLAPSDEKDTINGMMSTQASNTDMVFRESIPTFVPESFVSFASVERNDSPDMKIVKAMRALESPQSQKLVFSTKRRRLSKSDVPMLNEGLLPEEFSFSPGLDGHKNLPDLPAQIRPPQPKVSSTIPFSTHVTKGLLWVVEHVDMSRYFKPTYQKRPLSAFERGHWYLQIPIKTPLEQLPHSRDKPSATAAVIRKSRQSTDPSWTLDSFLQLWGYLTTFVGRQGAAGWGVWCFCDRVCDQVGEFPVQNLGLRVYAWGEIAVHTFLLLFLASNREIRRLPDIQWRDGNGKPVIRIN